MSRSAVPHRNPTADFLKGVAVVLMIQVHVTEQFAVPDVVLSVAGQVSLFLGGPPAAPVFLAVMGFFLSLSNRAALSLMRRGLLLIIGGLALNIGLNANLLYSIHQGRFNLDPLAFLFGADILPLAGISIIFIALLRSLFRSSPIAYIGLALGVGMLAVIPAPQMGETLPAVQYVQPFFWSDAWWSYFPVIPWLAYPLLGYAFGVMSINIPSQHRWAATSVLIILLVSTSGVALPEIVDLPRYYHHDIRLMLWNAAFLLVWLQLLSALHNRFPDTIFVRYLRWLGVNVTAVFVVQWLIIGNIATELYQTQSPLQAVLWFLAVLLVTSLAVISYRRARTTLIE